jgi:tetratricopeptide (TPR) repeat protein
MIRTICLCTILLLVACSQTKTAEHYFDEGAQAFEKGDMDQALALYEQGLKLEPKSALGHNLHGMACRMKFSLTGDPTWQLREITSFEASINIDSNYVPALMNLGATYYYSGEKAKAVPYFRHALEVSPGHPEAEMIQQMIAEGETQ